MRTKHALLFAAALLSVAVQAKGILDVPVAAVSNKVYLTDMEMRPWWNDAWRKRAAILVSNMSDVRVAKAPVDFVFDVGEEIDPKSVRVLTPWGTLVDCVAERVVVSSCSGRKDDSALQLQLPTTTSSTAVRLLFQTALRERENKPFFVYWDNPAAKAQEVFSPMTMSESDSELRINNGVVEVTFDRLHRTPGLIKTLRVNASDAASELLWRTTEYAWSGFEFWSGPIGQENWTKGEVVTDNALKKVVRFSGKSGELDFILYAGQSRVDYAYRLKPGVGGVNIAMSWAPGGNVGYDDFYYTGLAGKTLTFPASIDHPTDCLKQPTFYDFPWVSLGWYAIRDRKSHDVVGMVFDRDSTYKIGYLGRGQCDGLNPTVSFNHKLAKDAGASGSGALVATIGEVSAVRREYEFLKNRPRVFVAKVQPWTKIPVKVPDLKHDFCVNCNVGGWRSSTPLDGGEWTTNIINHIRALGANTLLLGQLTDYKWTDLPLTKEAYDALVPIARPILEKRKQKVPEWSPEAFDGRKLRSLTGAAHANGMAVCTWHGSFPGLIGYGDAFNPDHLKANFIIQPFFAKAGVDSIFNKLGMDEGPPVPQELVKKYGRQWWKWEDPSLFFKHRRETAAEMRKFYEHAHKECPDAAVMTFHSDNTELGREMFMPYLIGTMDTSLCEFVAHFDYDKVKQTAKRQRAFFDNEEARTIFAHYYFMEYDYAQRVRQTELPFTCGINGFSQESMTYENFDRDFFDITADFSRFALHSRLGEKVAKMGPVKNLAVLWDMNCVEQDLLKRRIQKRGWWEVAQHDLRVMSFAELYNYNYDIVYNVFFNAKSLSRYNVVYVPENDVLSDALVKELLAFVKNGGGAIVEGVSGEKVNSTLQLQLETTTSHGKGKIVWTKDVLTDKLIKRDAKAMTRVKELLASVGSKNPYEIESKTLDGVLQASKEGMFLGVFNRNDRNDDTGRVIINDEVRMKNDEWRKDLYVLDVKRGVRFPYKDGFEITVGPHQCGFYLIGDEKFTAIPEAKEAEWTGPSATSVRPNGRAPALVKDPDFKALSVVEFVPVVGSAHAGAPTLIRRSLDAKLKRTRFCLAEDKLVQKLKLDETDAWLKETGVVPYEPKSFSRALAKAGYLHVKVGAADCDDLFEDNAEDLKALLTRGGGILFDGVVPGPKAKKFLAAIGVFDPSDSLKAGLGDGTCVKGQNLPDTHALASQEKIGQFGGSLNYSRLYTQWDKKNQIAAYVARLAPDAALMVIQENVLGKGRIGFLNCESTFTDWYENAGFGNSVLSWLLGMSVKEHAEKVQDAAGGYGNVVE